MSRYTKYTYLNGDPAIEMCGKIVPYYDSVFKCIKKLAHYEDLEEQGRLIELPCKVGDTVY